MKKTILTFVLVAVIAAGGITATVTMKRKTDQSWRVIPRAPVQSGEFTVTIPEVGIIMARRDASATAPFSDKIIELVPEEAVVEKGDPVAWLDTTRFEDEIIHETAAFEQAKVHLERTLEQLRLDLEKNKLTIEQTKGDLEFSRIEAEFAREKYEKVQKLVDADVVAQRDLDDAEAEFREKKYALKRAEADYESALAESRVNEMINQIAQEHARADFARAQRRFEQGKESLEQAVVRAPAAGTVFYARVRNHETRRYEKIEEGDEVDQGDTIVKIPDLTDMLVKSQVDESEIGRIEEGMRVIVRVDAYPDEELGGTIELIGAVAIDREDSQGAGFYTDETEEDQVFELTVKLDSSDLDLRPGSTCELEIVTETEQDVMYVPLDAVFRVEGEDIVYVAGEESWERRVIETGNHNRKSIIVTEGIERDDEVLLREPRADDRNEQPQRPAMIGRG